jgi:hypothetical protein
MVGVAMSATEAAAVISPLKPTSASPFVLEPDLLDFEPYLIHRSGTVYPEMRAGNTPEARHVCPRGFTKLEPNAAPGERFTPAVGKRRTVAGKRQ